MLTEEALEVTKHFETTTNDEDSKSHLQSLEGSNPATNCNLVCEESEGPIFIEGRPKKKQASELQLVDPEVQYPDIYHVSLNKEEHKIWLKFKEFDKDIPTLSGIKFSMIEEQLASIQPDHAFVQFIGVFAVGAFNKAIEMHAKNKQDRLYKFEVKGCKYHKLRNEYWFYLTIEAMEDVNLGVYESKIACLSDDGEISLCRFERTSSTRDDKRATATASENKSKEDCWSDIESSDSEDADIEIYHYFGLVRRATCKGYYFYSPLGMDKYF